MPPLHTGHAPNLSIFLKSLKSTPIQSSIENFISLLKRRQIHGSRPCAIATAHLILHIVVKFKWTDVGKLLELIAGIGQRLIEAQPREVVLGNIVSRVRHMIKNEIEENRQEIDSDSVSIDQTELPWKDSSNSTLKEGLVPKTNSLLSLGLASDIHSNATLSSDTINTHFRGIPKLSRTLTASHMSYAGSNGLVMPQTMFNLLSTTNSPYATPPGVSSSLKSNLSASSLALRIDRTTKDIKAEILAGIREIIDEIAQESDLIAGYALEHIHSNEIILTHSFSQCVHKFLLKAAEKRKFTVIMAESYPNVHDSVHSAVMGKCGDDSEEDDEMNTESFLEPLSAAGITVILISDSSIFAIMSRVNKVIFATHAVIANGGLIADAGARIIAKAAKVHRIPVIVVSGVYKLSPEYPYEVESLIEYGDPGKVVPFDNGDLVENLEIDNPVYDYVPPDLVDLYITNLGAHAPSYLYRIVADHYSNENQDPNKWESLWTL
ncbi:putative translation initiation factor eIF-2B subunit beta [Erysiphe neolycopersici]|uniref:Translation initiation factor eIF2B subunit beta n=1 Tax=Erysiphe neolycopersici TaxID=212602 RepID=A0A420HYI4_9PEZI|nr:putative translation initiation factor eIF-2B subunit beta [Erysiphe neolycopersici]